MARPRGFSKNGKTRFDGKLGDVLSGLMREVEQLPGEPRDIPPIGVARVVAKAKKAAGFARSMPAVLAELNDDQAKVVQYCLDRAAERMRTQGTEVSSAAGAT